MTSKTSKISTTSATTQTPTDLRIATRGSPLALWQARHVAARLGAAGIKTSLHVVKTTGDIVQDRFLHEIGGKGLFVKELEEAMLAGHADIAVHSLKDMPVNLSPAFRTGAILKRHLAHDVLIVRAKSAASAGLSSSDNKWLSAADLASAGPLTVGTSSLRRSSLFARHAPKLRCLPVRGNVDTRLRKLHDGQFDAIVLAAASLERLGDALWEHLPRPGFVVCSLDADEFIPCAGQGALAIEIPNNGDLFAEILRPLHCAETAFCVEVERSVLRSLGGDCTMPFGALCRNEVAADGQRQWIASATLLSNDGEHASTRVSGTMSDDIAPGHIATRMLSGLSEQGAADILTRLRLPVPDAMRLN